MTHFDVRFPALPRYPEGEPNIEWASELIRQLYIRDQQVNNQIQLIELTGTFAIDSTGEKTVTIDNEFGFIPSAEHIMLCITNNTAVEDWEYDQLRLKSISSTQVVAVVDVETASGTGAATANLNIWVRP